MVREAAEGTIVTHRKFYFFEDATVFDFFGFGLDSCTDGGKSLVKGWVGDYAVSFGWVGSRRSGGRWGC